MQKISVLFFSILLFIGIFFSFSQVSLAVGADAENSMLLNGFQRAGNVGGLIPQNEENFKLTNLIGNIVEIGLTVLGLVFLLFVVYGGVSWMTAMGNETNTKKAQAMIVNAAIGLAVTLLAYQATQFVIKQIQIKELATPPVQQQDQGNTPPPSPAPAQ